MNSCPKCNSTNIAIYIYGYSGVGKFKKNVDAGKIVLGGHNTSKSKPDYHCNKCQHEWVTPPGERICDSCADVVMYCTCIEEIIDEYERNKK